jgi:hypothetical protein
MTDHPDRQRIRPTLDGRVRLLAAVEIVGPPHVLDLGSLGEYAELVAVRGQAAADTELPEVAAHLADGCASCADDLRELTALAGAPDAPAAPEIAPAVDPVPPTVGPLYPQGPVPGSGELRADARPLPPTGDSLEIKGAGIRGPSVVDSGIHAADLPDPRAAEAARRQRLRRIRDWLLIAAAVSALLIGLSLVGLSYVANSQPPARLGLTPLPAGTSVPGGPGRAAPSGVSCPPSHPIKGNRSSMIYHLPGADFYEQTRPEDCFASPADAEAAGYRASLR